MAASHGITRRAGAALLVTLATSAAVAAGPAAGGATPPIALRLNYHATSIGEDGVTRDSRYADLMFRGADIAWIERDLPRALRGHGPHGHPRVPGPHAGHAHDEAQGAPLLIRRQEDGSGAVQVVLQKQRRVIDVELAHHGNVGYGGSWAAAYWLLDPAALARMEKVGAAKNGVQRYRLRNGERTTVIDWDEQLKFARRIRQQDGHGLNQQEMVATPIPLPAAMPWQRLGDYARGDYSDLLD